MKSQEYDNIRPYLLGLIQQNEQSQIEERLLTDSDFYEELLAVEDELIDDYLAGELSLQDRRNFEEHFLITPEREQKVRFGRALKKYIAEENARSAPTPRWWSYPADFLSSRSANAPLALAAMVLIVLGISWVAIRSLQQQTPNRPSSDSIVTVVLTPGLAREGGEITRISIPPDKETVQLRLALPQGDYQKYQVTVITSQGTEVWTGTNLQPEQLPEGKFVVVNLPSSLLRRDDYQAKLSGQLPNSNVEDIASYTFRVSR